MSRARSEDKADDRYLAAFSSVVASDISIRIVLHLNKAGKGVARDELLKASLAWNEGIFEYNVNQLARLGVISSDSPCALTKLGEIIVKNLRQVLP